MIKYAFWDCTHFVSNKFLRDYLRALFYQLADEFVMMINHDLERIVENADDCDHLVVMQSGLTLKHPVAFKQGIIEFCQQDFLIAGQIIYHVNTYPFIHPQLFIINMNHYRRCGRPMIGYHEDSDVLDLHQPERSVDNQFADYTPSWLRPTGDIVACVRREFGWNLIHESLNHGLTVKALRGPAQWAKRFLYPNDKSHTFAGSLAQLSRGELHAVPSNLNSNQQDYLNEIIAATCA